MKIKSIFIFIVFFYVNYSLFSQADKKTLRINGIVNADSGAIFLMPINPIYYPQNKKLYEISSKIIKGSFGFIEKISYPHSYQIGIKVNNELVYLSNYFVIEEGEKNIRCNIDSLRELPKIKSKSMTELIEYEKLYLSVNQELEYIYQIRDSLKIVHDSDKNVLDSIMVTLSKKQIEISYKKKLILLNYTRLHPNSFIALWKLVQFLEAGYEPIFDNIYSLFSAQIKNTYTAKVILKTLKTSNSASLGKKFPQLQLLDRDNNKVLFPLINEKKVFTFVDFWYSRCSPCISEFPKYKELYNKYKNDGFEIVAISVDKKVDINRWKKIIQEQNLNWVQFLDKDGVNTERLSISSFPRNFLLNENNLIIEKDLTPERLSIFLKDKMKR